jgi:protein O-GlcNAc transferase
MFASPMDINRRYNGSAPASAGFKRPPAGSATDALLSRAIALQQGGDLAAAEELYRRFLSTHPTHLLALNNAGVVAKARGRPDVAVLRLTKALRHHPDSAETHFNLANALQELHRLDDAIGHYRRAIALKPAYPKACLNLGNALDKLRRFEEAAGWFQKALEHGGDNAETHANLGRCLRATVRLREAVAHFTVAAQLEPERAEMHYLVGLCRHELHERDKAAAAFRRALELDPAHENARTSLMFQLQVICDWTEAESLAPLVRGAVDEALGAGKACAEGAFDSLTRDADPARNRLVATASALPYVTEKRLYRARPRRAAPAEKIRLGYLSFDFRDHPIAQVIGGVFSRHDRSRFHVTAYSYGHDDASVWRQRIARDCDSFVDLHRVVDDECARRIHEDGTEILIDLTSWTHGSRPRICALRPAAVQLQYLGFPGTSGARHFDYAIVDRTVVPPEHQACWSERLIFMPHTYFVADRDQTISAVGLRRDAFGLPEQGIVFCSFNQSYKIEPVVFDAWTRILAQVPGSVLWLPYSNETVRANLRGAAARRGIDDQRLIFAATVGDKAQHLERLGLADIALDTLAYNGHTTTSDALWAGVPVVAALGRHFASRVGASLLKSVELDELIARDADDYVRIAVRLAERSEERARLRSHLSAGRHRFPLFDTDRSVADLERAYEQIWAKHLAGDAPSDVHL